MRVILDVKDTEWNFLSDLLKRFAFVRIQQADAVQSASDTPTFTATQLDTTGYKFNREEANGR